MVKFKKLTKDLDYTNTKVCEPLDWDVVLPSNSWIDIKIEDTDEGHIARIGNQETLFLDYNIKMRVYRIYNYYHFEGNDLYICKRDEKPSLETLTPFNDENWELFGIKCVPIMYYRKNEMRTSFKTTITRNGEDFDTITGFTMEYSLVEAQHMINKIKNHLLPFCFHEIDFEKKIVGYKCEWKDRPCTITSYIKGQNCVMLDIKAKEDEYDSGEKIKDHLFSSSFNWYPKQLKE